jgi:mannose-1-phosphate guanylyltransferase / mannose-6-phosphate isomerase
MTFISVVLSGGVGTRLWPVSRQATPKPFMKLGGTALLEQAIARGQACGTDELLVVTNQDHLFLTQNLIGDMANPPRTSYLLEPKGRNTAPAIALAALAVAKRYGADAVMLVLPADHLIPNTQAFAADALQASRHAQQGQLVVFGIQPTSPETGYGYIEVAQITSTAQPVLKFVEKPDIAKAAAYLATGRYYWNSGMFCFTAGTLLDALAEYAPAVLQAAQHTFATASSAASEFGNGLAAQPKSTTQITRFEEQAFGLQPDISIDYALMERAANVMLVPAQFAWSDVGSWPAVANAHTADENGNTRASPEFLDWVAIDTSNTHIHFDAQGQKHLPLQKRVIATIGIHNTIVVHTPDALLIADKNRSQDVKKVVDALKERQIDSKQAPSSHTTGPELPHTVSRPWGSYTTIKEAEGYKVKRISVLPGQALSLQYHHKRAEHWTVVKGQGIVQIGNVEYPTYIGEYHYIPLGERHRLTNNGTEELVLIEVQTGIYLGEDDIVRLQDQYGRA